jgi:hypothetical protein
VVDVPLVDLGSPPAGTRLATITSSSYTSSDPANALQNNADDAGPGQANAIGETCVNGVSTVPADPATPPPGPAPCSATSPQITDVADDATGLVLASTPRPSDDSLDILQARVTFDGTKLTFRTSVKQAADAAPAGSTAAYYDIGFFYGDNAYYVEVVQDALGTLSGSVGSGSDTRGTKLADTAVAPTIDGNDVVLVLGLDEFNGAAKPATPLAAGQALKSFSAITWREEGGPAGGVDSAGGTCPFTL